jgi:hypothetical protein
MTIALRVPWASPANVICTYRGSIKKHEALSILPDFCVGRDYLKSYASVAVALDYEHTLMWDSVRDLGVMWRAATCARIDERRKDPW